MKKWRSGCLETSDLENTDLRPDLENTLRKHRPRKLRPLENTDTIKIEMYYGHAITTRKFMCWNVLAQEKKLQREDLTFVFSRGLSFRGLCFRGVWVFEVCVFEVWRLCFRGLRFRDTHFSVNPCSWHNYRIPFDFFSCASTFQHINSPCGDCVTIIHLNF